jgi:hypothetical protein
LYEDGRGEALVVGRDYYYYYYALLTNKDENPVNQRQQTLFSHLHHHQPRAPFEQRFFRSHH